MEKKIPLFRRDAREIRGAAVLDFLGWLRFAHRDSSGAPDVSGLTW
jgi:hypothetical protein